MSDDKKEKYVTPQLTPLIYPTGVSWSPDYKADKPVAGEWQDIIVQRDLSSPTELRLRERGPVLVVDPEASNRPSSGHAGRRTALEVELANEVARLRVEVEQLQTANAAGALEILSLRRLADERDEMVCNLDKKVRKLRADLALEQVFAKNAGVLARLAYKPSPDDAAQLWEDAARAYREESEERAREVEKLKAEAASFELARAGVFAFIDGAEARRSGASLSSNPVPTGGDSAAARELWGVGWELMDQGARFDAAEPLIEHARQTVERVRGENESLNLSTFADKFVELLAAYDAAAGIVD